MLPQEDTELKISGVVKTQFTFNIFGYSVYATLFPIVLLMTISQMPYTTWSDENNTLPGINETMYWMAGPLSFVL